MRFFLLFKKDESVFDSKPVKSFTLTSNISILAVISLLFSIREAVVGEKSQEKIFIFLTYLYFLHFKVSVRVYVFPALPREGGDKTSFQSTQLDSDT